MTNYVKCWEILFFYIQQKCFFIFILLFIVLSIYCFYWFPNCPKDCINKSTQFENISHYSDVVIVHPVWISKHQWISKQRTDGWRKCGSIALVISLRDPGMAIFNKIDTGHDSQKERDPLGRPWHHMGRKEKSHPNPLDQCNRREACAHGIWPDCEHYPYNNNPGCAPWVITFASVLPIGALVLSIYALAIRLPYNGFSFSNNLKFPSGFHWGFGDRNHTLPPIDPADPKSTVLLWALIFRSAPTYIAGLFTSTIVTWIDLNMRFMQPFRNMFGEGPEKSTLQHIKDWFGWRLKEGSSAAITEEERKPAKAADTILLAYITVSPLQVPLTAWEKGHLWVCIYSTLNTSSPLFPILVGGLLIVTPDEKSDRVNFTFSMSAYVGLMIYLTLYSILLPGAIPGADQLLPRQLYSLADLMAMCHESRFMTSPHLNVTDRARTPFKQHMEARILLTDDRFLFGRYRGRDEKLHIWFDVAQERESDFGPLRPVRFVRYIPPATRFLRTMTTILETGGRTLTGAMSGGWNRAFSQQAHGVPIGDEQEAPPQGEATGIELQQPRAGGLTRTSTRFELPIASRSWDSASFDTKMFGYFRLIKWLIQTR